MTAPKKCRSKEYTLLFDRKSLNLLDSYIIDVQACLHGKKILVLSRVLQRVAGATAQHN